MASLDKFIYRLFRKGEIDQVQLKGRTVGTVSVLIKDSAGKILLATGTTVPNAGGATYAKGAIFIDTDVADGISAIYENTGTALSYSFTVLPVAGTGASAALSAAVVADAVVLSSGVSAAVSVSKIASTNLVTSDSKAASNSTIISNINSRITSHSL